MARDFRSDTAKRLTLSQVTLCAVTSINVQATIRALEICLEQANFFACKLFTDSSIRPNNSAIEVVNIPKLESSAAYSEFLLVNLVEHIETSHCLVAQWDGHVLAAERWRSEFLDYDYIGASWTQFDDGRDVGNGGFSLRSRALMEACRASEFIAEGAEDIAIGRTNRAFLEQHGFRFAPKALADMFSAERSSDPSVCFGYHGVFNMPRAIGIEEFWQVYLTLDDLSTVWVDFRFLLKEVRKGSRGIARMSRMAADQLKQAIIGYRA